MHILPKQTHKALFVPSPFPSPSEPNPNLIPQQHLRGRALPAAVPARGNHKVTRGIEIELGDDAGAVAGYD